MEPTNQPQHTVEERDGRLVVVEARKRRRWALRLPLSWPGLPRLPWQAWGVALFQRRHYPDYNDGGDAFVQAATLSLIEDLDARSDDWFWLSLRQQAVLGWMSYASWGAVIFAAAVFLILQYAVFPWFLLFAIAAFGLVIVANIWWTQFAQEIQWQRLEQNPADPGA